MLYPGDLGDGKSGLATQGIGNKDPMLGAVGTCHVVRDAFPDVPICVKSIIFVPLALGG